MRASMSRNWLAKASVESSATMPDQSATAKYVRSRSQTAHSSPRFVWSTCEASTRRMIMSCSAPLSSFGKGRPARERTAVTMRKATAGNVVTGRACEIADNSRITRSPKSSAICRPDTVITACVSPYRLIAAISARNANSVLPLRGAPATNVTSARSSKSIMPPKTTRPIASSLCTHRTNRQRHNARFAITPHPASSRHRPTTAEQEHHRIWRHGLYRPASMLAVLPRTRRPLNMARIPMNRSVTAAQRAAMRTVSGTAEPLHSTPMPARHGR